MKEVRKVAEFCLDCWNELNHTNYHELTVTLSDDLDLCEGCGQWKPVVVLLQPPPYHRRVKIVWKALKEHLQQQKNKKKD